MTSWALAPEPRPASCGNTRQSSMKTSLPWPQAGTAWKYAPLPLWKAEAMTEMFKVSSAGEHFAAKPVLLLVFLHDGRVEMDTNFVENRIRPVKLTAKNALFAGHDEGAAAWGRIASLLETCKMNGVEPYVWLKSTLEKIAGGHPQSRIRELLPWNFGPASS